MSSEHIAKALAEYARRDQAAKSLSKYVPYTLEYEPASHHQIICNKLDEVIAGTCKRLIIAAPPGCAKSTYTSYGFAGYAMGKMPSGSKIIAASHTDEFAQSWGRKVRNLCQSEGHARVFPQGIVSPDDRSAARWSTIGGNEYFAVGVGGSVTGHRANILLCDDLLRGREDADSKKRREMIRNWFMADAYTRLKPGGAIVIIATRWHEDDLTGTLLDAMESGGEHWDFLKLEALCEHPEEDPMKRLYGEHLWPEYWTQEHLLNIRDRSGMSARDWASLYQQHPSPEDGNMIQRVWFNKFTRHFFADLMRECEIVVTIDTAIKGHERSDPTVALIIARHRNGNHYLLEEMRVRAEFPEMKKAVHDFLDLHQQTYPKFSGILVENKGNGEALASSLRREIKIPVIALEPKQIGDKEFRFDKCSPIFEGGQFYVPSDEKDKKWVDAYIDELVTFPAARNDDRVDATSQALNWWSNRMVRKRRQRRVVGLQ